MAARPAAATQPLRGRDAEQAVIDAALGQARDGRGGVLLVEGGAGLGKSRLLEEAMRLAGRAGLRAAVGRADVDDNAVPLAPLMSACFGGNAPLLASIIHPQGAAVGGSGPVGAYACYARFLVLRGYAKHPAGGPGGRGFHVPRGLLPCLQGRFRAGQGACGRASIRCHAAVIASAQGQVAWIFRRRRRPPRTIRAAACSTRYRSVFGSALARSPSRASSFSQASRMQAVIEAVSQAALILKSWEGKWPRPVSFPVRMASSTRAWTR